MKRVLLGYFKYNSVKKCKVFSAFSERRAFSSVVATALLLVVAVVSIVGFQCWFGSYSSSVLADAEINSASSLDGRISIDGVVGNTLYVINRLGSVVNVTELKLDNYTCSDVTNLSIGMNEVNITDCKESLTSTIVDVVLITENDIVVKTVLIDDTASGSPSSPVASLVCVLSDYKNDSSCIDNMVVDGCGAGTVGDSETGLCWQRNMTQYYDYDGTKLNWTQAIAYCDTLSLGGNSDWRMPSRQEFNSLLDLSRSNPSLIGDGNNKFLGVDGGYYWTATTSSIYTHMAWCGYVFDGNVDPKVKSTDGYSVACVRSTSDYFVNSSEDDGYGGYGQIRDADSFAVDGCGAGTVLDSVTDLCWQKNISQGGTMTWVNTVAYCEGLGGNWRLPTRAELLMLVNEFGGENSTCTSLESFGFTDCANDYYSSSSEYEPNTGTYMWGAYFVDADGPKLWKGGSMYPFCVYEN